jgi:hypothetical protein
MANCTTFANAFTPDRVGHERFQVGFAAPLSVVCDVPSVKAHVPVGRNKTRDGANVALGRTLQCRQQLVGALGLDIEPVMTMR